jgi:hypothetical protein
MKLLHLTWVPLWGLSAAVLCAPALATFGETRSPDRDRAAVSAEVKQETLIQVVTQSEETLYFNTDTIYALPMRVDRTVTVNGITLREGTVVEGRLEPVEGGLRYVASHIQAGGFQRSLDARSEVLRDIKDPRETSAEAIAGDAAIGAAGGVVLGAILGGGVSAGEVIGGAAAGVIIGNVTAQRVVVIEPGQPVILYAGDGDG